MDAAFAALLDAERDLLEELPERDRTRLASLLRSLPGPVRALTRQKWTPYDADPAEVHAVRR